MPMLGTHKCYEWMGFYRSGKFVGTWKVRHKY